MKYTGDENNRVYMKLFASDTTDYFRYVTEFSRADDRGYYNHFATKDDAESVTLQDNNPEEDYWYNTVIAQNCARFNGPDVLYLVTKNIILDSQNSQNHCDRRVMLPVNCNPKEIIHYSVNDTEETVPFSFYQNLNNMELQLIDPITVKLIPDPTHIIYLMMRLYFRHGQHV